MLNGYDVSSYQTGIKNLSGDFVVVKATEGTNYVNPDFKRQANQALKGGKKLALYHFGRNGNLSNEVKFFCKTVKPYIGKAILVLDYEPSNIYVHWAKCFLDETFKRTGVRPMIYLGLAVENAYNWSPVVKGNYGLWVAQYNNYKTVHGYKPRKMFGSVRHWKYVAMFQYTSVGRLSGWKGPLDLDVFYGNKKTWDAYAKKLKK